MQSRGNPSVDPLVADHDQLLLDIADDLYTARRGFLRESFDGYPADTIYWPERDVYLYWPVKDEGRFVGFDDPTPGERAVIDRAIAEHGFEFLGNGCPRIVVAAPPPYDDLAIKFGRCGTNLAFGNGRKHLLVEREFTREFADQAPIVPCWHVSPHGEYGVYPRTGPDLETTPPNDMEVFEELRRETRDVIPYYPSRHGVDVTSRLDNAVWWDGDPYIADYCWVPRNRPQGVPSHVDGDRVIERVDELRRRGEKMDLGPNRILVEPDIRS